MGLLLSYRRPRLTNGQIALATTEMRYLQDLDVRGKRVLVRVDFNVPIQDGVVADDTRIRAALPTIEYLLESESGLVLCSHLGRPKGKLVPELSLEPVAAHLAEVLGRPVGFVDQTVGQQAVAAARKLGPGELLVLENTRFSPEETENDPAFAKQLAELADIYVNDAFGTAHRAHASTEGVAHLLPSAAGFLIERELQYLREALKDPARPYVGILGGAKISDKIGVVEKLLEQVDVLLVGGAMANTFLAAQDLDMASSLVEKSAIQSAKQFLHSAHGRIELPSDAIVADRFAAEAVSATVQVNAVPENWQILDIGPDTVSRYSSIIRGAGTVVWNGPMGVFEFKPFAAGTRRIAEAVAASGAVTVIGGGDSVAAVQRAGLSDQITHLSTGGGASLAVIEGRELPGLTALGG